jgi:phage tail-like protein
MSDTQTTPTRTTDPPFTGRFTFQVDGVELGSFMEVSGLSVQVEVEELVEGGVNGYVHRLPGRMKWPNLLLKRGVTKSDVLFAWLASMQQGYSSGKPEKPSNASVVLCGPQGDEVRRWSVEGAYPVKWTGPKLAATSNELALEELEICHRGFRSS